MATQPLAARETFLRERTFLGEVRARRSSMLGFEVPGALISVDVDEGDAAAAGTVLATLDTARLRAAKTEAEAGLEETQAAADLAHSTLIRLERARESNAVSAQQVDEAARQVDRQNAAVTRAQAQVNRLEVDIAKSTLVAPYDGQVQRRFADEGTVIGVGQPVLEIRQSGAPEIRFSIEPSLVGNVTVGQTLTASTAADSDIEMTVTRVLPARDPGTRAVPVFADVSSASADLRDGDLVEVSLTQREARAGFWVPLTALAESARGLWSCYIAEPIGTSAQHKLVRREVEILSLQSERAYVTGNLRMGEQLVVDGLHRVVPGQAVRLSANL